MIHSFRKGIFFFFLFLLIPGMMGNLPHKAWGEDIPQAAPVETEEKTSGSVIGVWFASLFRDHISAIDSDRCPSHPSCSAYAVEAFKKHGFFLGWMMTVDRLFHEGKEEIEVSSPLFIHGGMKIFDPVENNDFWWFPKEGKRNEETGL